MKEQEKKVREMRQRVRRRENKKIGEERKIERKKKRKKKRKKRDKALFTFLLSKVLNVEIFKNKLFPLF